MFHNLFYWEFLCQRAKEIEKGIIILLKHLSINIARCVLKDKGDVDAISVLTVHVFTVPWGAVRQCGKLFNVRCKSPLFQKWLRAQMEHLFERLTFAVLLALYTGNRHHVSLMNASLNFSLRCYEISLTVAVLLTSLYVLFVFLCITTRRFNYNESTGGVSEAAFSCRFTTLSSVFLALYMVKAHFTTCHDNTTTADIACSH